MNNVKRIQQELRRRGLDGMLVTDEKNQRYASGFPITDGAVVVGLEKSWLITDSRYIEAAEAAVDGSLTEVVLYDREHPLTGIIRSVCAGMVRLAAEDKKLSHVGYLGYEKALGRELLPAGDLFETLRASKSEDEIACMRMAVLASNMKCQKLQALPVSSGSIEEWLRISTSLPGLRWL